MAVRLPEPIAAYFAATSTHNVDAMLAGFADGAVVRDEGPGAARPSSHPGVDGGNNKKISIQRRGHQRHRGDYALRDYSMTTNVSLTMRSAFPRPRRQVQRQSDA